MYVLANILNLLMRFPSVTGRIVIDETSIIQAFDHWMAPHLVTFLQIGAELIHFWNRTESVNCRKIIEDNSVEISASNYFAGLSHIESVKFRKIIEENFVEISDYLDYFPG